MKNRDILFLFLLFLLLSTSCGGGSSDSTDTNFGNKNTGEESSPLHWSTCSLYEGENDGRAECAGFMAPLFYDNPDDGREIEIGLKRYLVNGESNGQIWLLQGGPGFSGIMSHGYSQLAETIQEIRNLDVYIIDHRGTGYSTYLSCPQVQDTYSVGNDLTPEEWESCFAYVDEALGENALQGFSTTNAARDIDTAMEMTRENGKEVFVYGASYGTYLAQRYLTLYPYQADAVIMDSAFSNDEPALIFPMYRNEAGKRLMDLCGDDAFCSSKLGDDPWTKLKEVSQSLEEGHCPDLGLDRWGLSLDGIDYGSDRWGLGWIYNWLMWFSPYNQLMPALVYRIDRCNQADLQAIDNMWLNVFNGTGELIASDREKSYSALLGMNISISDMYWSSEYNGRDMEQFFEEMAPDIYVSWFPATAMYSRYQSYLDWPKYQDELTETLPQTDIPILIIQGGIDGILPPEGIQSLALQLSGPNQHYVEHPTAAHGALYHSACTFDIFAQFIKNPAGILDTSCIVTDAPFNFIGSQDLAKKTFGTNDIWEND